MGMHSRWPIPDVVAEQLRLAHELREELVSLELGYEAAVQAIWSSYPQVAAAEKILEDAQTAAATAAEAVSAQRVRQRTTRVSGAPAERLAAARAQVRQARRARREAIAAVRSQAKDRIGAAATELRDARRGLYRRYCQDGDLYWATYNDVMSHHIDAVKRIRQARAAGRPARLRHRRFDGTGSIAVQLQRRAGDPARTPQVLADPGGRYRNVLVLPWIEPSRWQAMSRAQQRQHGRVEVRFRCGAVGGDPVWVNVPVQQHRMLGADADIIGARLTLTRTAGHLAARLTVTANLPEPAEIADGPAVAIHLGWRDTDAGIQVASWRSTAPLAIPPDMQSVILTDSGALTGTIVLPHRIAERISRAAAMRSQRDLALETVRARLVAWLSEHGPVTDPGRADHMLEADTVRRWRSAARFAALAQAWRADPPAGGRQIADELECWRRADRALWERQEHGRGKASRNRDDLYRRVAAALCSAQVGEIVVDDTSIAVLAALPSELPAPVAAWAAQRRVAAAPGRLRAAITSAAASRGIPVSVVPAAGLSRIHARCGHDNSADDEGLGPPVVCRGCGASYDPDASATLLMLARAGTQPRLLYPGEHARVDGAAGSIQPP